MLLEVTQIEETRESDRFYYENQGIDQERQVLSWTTINREKNGWSIHRGSNGLDVPVWDLRGTGGQGGDVHNILMWPAANRVNKHKHWQN
jgi:hypothetical protein